MSKKVLMNAFNCSSTSPTTTSSPLTSLTVVPPQSSDGSPVGSTLPQMALSFLPASPPSTVSSTTNSPTRTPNTVYSNTTPPGRHGDESHNGTARKRGTGQPYIPSYMDLSNGPEPCVVCGDAATGYHYRCMTCEGCKGFFRRTIQKNLNYHCKWNETCAIDKNTRNQCQKCRYKKCITVGMATDLVLNEKQRVAKRKLIEDNRQRRKQEVTVKHRPLSGEDHGFSGSSYGGSSGGYTSGGGSEDSCSFMTDEDKELISSIVAAYENTSAAKSASFRLSVEAHDNYIASKMFAKSIIEDHICSILTKTDMVDKEDIRQLREFDPHMFQSLADLMTPSIVRVVDFAKGVPGFSALDVEDQILLLKSCCLEIMCLRAACRYDKAVATLTLQNGVKVTKSQLQGDSLGILVEPIFDFAVGLAKLNLDFNEIALLAGVLLMQSDRTGLKESEAVEKIQDQILGAFKRYVADKRPEQPVHWAKILMKVTDLRTISTRHAERVLAVKLDNPSKIPPLLLQMFGGDGMEFQQSQADDATDVGQGSSGCGMSKSSLWERGAGNMKSSPQSPSMFADELPTLNPPDVSTIIPPIERPQTHLLVGALQSSSHMTVPLHSPSKPVVPLHSPNLAVPFDLSVKSEDLEKSKRNGVEIEKSSS